MEVLPARGLVAAGGGGLAGGAHRFHSPFPVHASERALLAGCCTCYATAAMLLRGESRRASGCCVGGGALGRPPRQGLARSSVQHREDIANDGTGFDAWRRRSE